MQSPEMLEKCEVCRTERHTVMVTDVTKQPQSSMKSHKHAYHTSYWADIHLLFFFLLDLVQYSL